MVQSTQPDAKWGSITIFDVSNKDHYEPSDENGDTLDFDFINIVGDTGSRRRLKGKNQNEKPYVELHGFLHFTSYADWLDYKELLNSYRGSYYNSVQTLTYGLDGQTETLNNTYISTIKRGKQIPNNGKWVIELNIRFTQIR